MNEYMEKLKEKLEWLKRDISFKAPEQAADSKIFWEQKVTEILKMLDDWESYL